jgi:1,4-dihydroxy-2-naphthoate octaprenyltransferase
VSEGGSVRRWLVALRIYSLTASLSPLALVWLYGAWRGWDARWVVASLAGLAVVCLHLSVNLLNDVADTVRGIDTSDNGGGSGVIARGELSLEAVERVAVGLFWAGVMLGLPALWADPWEVAAIALVGVFGVWGYSGRRFGLKYLALGDLLVFVAMGPALTLGLSLASYGRWDFGVVLIGVLVGLAAHVILHTNNLQDAEIDAAHGARTWAQMLGFNGARWWIVGVLALMWVVLMWGVNSGFLPKGVVVAFAISLLPSVGLLSSLFQAKAAKGNFEASPRVRAAKTHLAFSAGLGLGLVLALAGLLTGCGMRDQDTSSDLMARMGQAMPEGYEVGYEARLAGVETLGRAFPGHVSVWDVSSTRELGLWGGIYLQTAWQQESGRDRVPLWRLINTLLTVWPSALAKVFAHEAEAIDCAREAMKLTRRDGEIPTAVEACESWQEYFLAVESRASFLGAQRLLWKAHTTTLRMGLEVWSDVLSLSRSALPVDEGDFWAGWASFVFDLERVVFPTYGSAIGPVNENCLPRCAVLGSESCRVETLPRLTQQAFARAMIARGTANSKSPGNLEKGD